MAYFRPYIDASGVHIPTYTDRMEDLLEQYRSIFGADAALTDASPDRQLLSVFARALDDLSALAAEGFASRDPEYARGAALDLLLPLCGVTRGGPTCSAVTLRLTGTPLAVLADAPRVTDAADRVWRLPAGITFDANGEAEASAVCEEPGAVEAAAGTVCRILTPMADLFSVNNAEPAVPGRDAEGDAAVRVRRRLAVTAPALGTEEALLNALQAVPGVRACRVYVNDAASADARGIPAHTVCAVVAGGDIAAVAETLFLKKAPGVGTCGNTPCTVTDAAGNAHTVRYERAAESAANVTVTLTALDGFDAAVTVPRIRNAVAALNRMQDIGQPLAVSSLYGVICGADPSPRPTFAVTGVTVLAGGRTGSVITPAWNERITFEHDFVTVNIA